MDKLKNDNIQDNIKISRGQDNSYSSPKSLIKNKR